MARRQSEESHQMDEEAEPPTAPTSPTSPGEASAGWDSQSEMTSVISGSSVWTDSSNAGDRSSRRALILQMAKARMKTGRPSSASVMDDRSRAPIGAEILTDPTKPVLSEKIGETISEPRMEVVNSDLDFTDELD
mmetsp:Transcript_50038/g.74701  ORF Transcript_50038/g.74701 Transcript_50038/m.74701 type:complete len:135 (-) Transcript_50038:690-1094(-)